jgi:hypothetical protein
VRSLAITPEMLAAGATVQANGGMGEYPVGEVEVQHVETTGR